MISNFSSSETKYFELTKRLRSNETHSMTHSELENMLSTEGRELIRRLFEEHCRLRTENDGRWKSIIGHDNVIRSYKQKKSRSLITLFGEITICRTGYSHPGKSFLFPADAGLNLTDDSYSFGIRKMVAIEVLKSSFTEAIESIYRYTGVTIPRNRAEMLVQKSAQDFDSYYNQKTMLTEDNYENTETANFLVMTTDSKGIVMRQEDLKEETRKKAEQSQTKLNKRLSKGEKKNRKRMATVASVYEVSKFVRTADDIMGDLANTTDTNQNKKEKKHEQKRPRPINKRVWASLEKSQEEVIDEIFTEALSRDPQKKKKWICLVDGEIRQLKIIKRKAKQYAVSLIIIIDIIHVIEYLWRAARVFYDESSKDAEKWVTIRVLEILKGNAGYVAGGVRRSATLLKVSKNARDPIDKCADYLLKYSPYAKYDQYLKLGTPIATGVIEGACRHVIKDRMDVTGARWRLNGAEAILKLRSIKTSGDFDEYWAFHEQQELARNHYSKYADTSIVDKLLFRGK